MILSITAAAKATGVSRTTLYEKINDGTLSRTSKGIDTAELLRVFGEFKGQGAESETPLAPIQNQQADIDLIAVDLLEIVREKDLELSSLRDDLKDSNKRLNEHREAARLLEHKNGEWEQALADRKAEIAQARTEADEMRQRQTEQAEALKSEKARVAALESRGLIDRIFNRPAKVTG